MPRIAVKVEYDGTDFRGWQLQPNGRTVQEVLERAVQQATCSHSRVHGAGRTDSGVHAEGQVAHFDSDTDIPAAQLVKALNHYLPADAAVLAAAEVDEQFHARFSAHSKLYRYRVLLSPVRRPLRSRFSLLESRPVDPEPMTECADIVRGSHDFASFATETHRRSSTVRRIVRSEWRREGDELHYHVEAHGFLYTMVRVLVGSMLQVGLGKMSVADFRHALEARDRTRAGPTVDACGLTLVHLKYPPGALDWQ